MPIIGRISSLAVFCLHGSIAFAQGVDAGVDSALPPPNEAQVEDELSDEAPPQTPPPEPVLPREKKREVFVIRSAKTANVKLGGYLQSQYRDRDAEQSTGSEDTFRVRRARLEVEGSIVKHVGFEVSLELSEPTTPLRDGYIWITLPHHEFRFGQQKTQFGYENVISAKRLWTANRAFASERIGQGADSRDIGVGVLGDWSLGDHFGLNYAVTFVNGAGLNTLDTTHDKNLFGRMGFSFAESKWDFKAELGASGAVGNRFATAGNPTVDFKRVGVNALIDQTWLWAAFEYIFSDNEVEAPGMNFQSDGWYVLLLGRTPWNLGPIFKIDMFRANRDMDARLRRFIVGAYYEYVPVGIRLLLNYEIDDSKGVKRPDTLIVHGQVVF